MIERVCLENFRSHERTEIGLGRLTIVAGRNASGKSSIRQAVEVALTGRCEVTDRAGRGLAECIRAGSKEATVTLAIRDLGDVVRTITHRGTSLQVGDWAGSVKTQQEVLMRHMGTTEDLVAAICRAAEFPALSTKDQQVLLEQVCGSAIDRAAAAAALLDAGVSPDFVEELPEDLTLGWLADAYRQAYERRRELRRERDRLAGQLDGMRQALQELGEPKNAEDLKAIRERLNALEAELEVLEGRVEAAVEAMTESEDLTARIAEFEAKLAELNGQEEDDAEDDPGEDRVLEAKAELEALAEQIRRADADIAAIKQATTCPVSAAITCPLTRQQRDQVTRELAKERGKLASRHGKLVQEYAELAWRREEARKRAEEKAAARRYREYLCEEIERLKARRAGIVAPDEDFDLNAAEERVEELRCLVRSARMEEARASAALEAATSLRQTEERLAALEAEVRRVEVLTEALAPGPEGIRSALLAATLDALEARVEENLATLAPAYQVQIDRGDFSILVDGPSGVVGLKHLSTSERLRVGCAITEALAYMAGLGILIIDDAEILDDGNRQAMSAWLLERRRDHDNILLLTTCPRERLRALPGVRVWWLESGIADEVGGHVEEVA